MTATLTQTLPDPRPLSRETSGKPSLLSQPIIDRVASKVRKGMYPGPILEGLGLHATCHAKWLEHAQHDLDNGVGDTIYVRYFRTIKDAEAEAEAEMAEAVRNAALAGPQYWAAGMTYLERRHPDRWGKRERTDTPQGNTSVQIVFVAAPGAQVAEPPAVNVISTQTSPALPAAETPPTE